MITDLFLSKLVSRKEEEEIRKGECGHQFPAGKRCLYSKKGFLMLSILSKFINLSFYHHTSP